MDNKIEHFFVLKPDGKIGWIENMPIDKYFDPPNPSNFHYRAALQSAIDNAVEVSNFDETEDALLDAHATDHGFRLEVGKIYSLQCSVEKIDNVYGIKIDNPVALVTFSQPEREETQEELWDDAIAITGVYYPSTFGRFKVIEELSKTFTITRKTP